MFSNSPEIQEFQESLRKSCQYEIEQTDRTIADNEISRVLPVLTVCSRTTGKNRVCQMNKHLLSKETPSSSEHHDLDVCSHHLQLMYITMG